MSNNLRASKKVDAQAYNSEHAKDVQSIQKNNAKSNLTVLNALNQAQDQVFNSSFHSTFKQDKSSFKPKGNDLHSGSLDRNTPDKLQMKALRQKQPSVLGSQTQHEKMMEPVNTMSDEAYKNANFSSSTASSTSAYNPQSVLQVNSEKPVLNWITSKPGSNSTEHRKANSQLRENGK